MHIFVVLAFFHQGGSGLYGQLYWCILALKSDSLLVEPAQKRAQAAITGLQ